ncbi:MAG: ArsA family ATPase, partial [Solirubrobacterales bacterium]|nr:ArsA family ATPase [Solirubrobacterales bacterium]
EPTPVGERLWGQEVSAQLEVERNWAAVQEWAGEVLVARGVDRISAEELTVPPGMDELFSLLQLKRHHESGEFDCVVVDCAPTGETLRLLSFPDVARWWLEKVFPVQGRLLDAARPLARAMLDVALPGEEVFDDVQRLVRNLIAMNEILRDHEQVSIRLVMTPDRMVVDEARRTFTYLNLYGFLTDAVVVNRVFPDDVGAYFGAWRARHAEALQAVREAFAPVPLLQAPFFAEEVVGGAMLDRLGEALFAGDEAEALLHRSVSERLEVGRDAATLRLDLPFADKGEISLKRLGQELIVRVDGHKRTLMLPPALDDYQPTGAAYADGALTVSFDRG